MVSAEYITRVHNRVAIWKSEFSGGDIIKLSTTSKRRYPTASADSSTSKDDNPFAPLNEERKHPAKKERPEMKAELNRFMTTK
jgi:hypothetical protein